MSRGIHKMRPGRLIVTIVGSVLGNVFSTTQTTHALGNIDVGSGGIRHAILGFTWSDGGTRTISSVTVGGESLAEKIAVGSGGGEQIGSAIWAGGVSAVSGSQAISVTFNTDTDSSAVSGVVVIGLDSLTPTMTDSDFNTSGAQMIITSLASPIGGIAIACAGGKEQSGDAIAWGSLTERVDTDTGGDGSDHSHGAAWDLGVRAASNETIDFTLSSNQAAVGAGFR